MKEMLLDIDASSVRLISIVNDFLEVSRLEQGKIEIQKENFDPHDLVNKVIRDLKEMTSKKGLTLGYEPEEMLVANIFADKNKTEQVLVNFIGNSVKFTKEGTIVISLAQEGNKIRFRVTDTGVGISEHNQSLLFRKFQQAGEKMLARDVSQSTGLGLYISKLIIATMGGEIGLEKSELGKGSTFFFTLPIAT
jgi:signal transduction histidine kinase